MCVMVFFFVVSRFLVFLRFVRKCFGFRLMIWLKFVIRCVFVGWIWKNEKFLKEIKFFVEGWVYR